MPGLSSSFCFGLVAVQSVVEAVYEKPHLRGDYLPHGTCVLPGVVNAGDDGVGVVAVKDHEVYYVLPGRAVIEASEKLHVPRDLYYGVPFLLNGVVGVDSEAEVYAYEPRGVPCALGVAAHPVYRFCDAA